ncbi:MAG: M48 family metalloprotease [Myxococcales bacterium]|jgi:hypothetical protein|nr:M48 family metalloprotease [Myxococcales bacterium]
MDSARSFALSRQQEFEADRFSAEATDARTAADALIASELVSWADEARFGSRLFQMSSIKPSPPDIHLSLRAEVLRAAYTADEASGVMAQALERHAVAGNTHPELAERLSALGQSPRIPAPPTESAAAVFLGDCLPRVQTELEAQWREALAEPWSKHYAEGQVAMARLAELDAKAEKEPLDAEEACAQAQIVERLRGAEAALPLAIEIAARQPDHALAQFQAGRLLLSQHDARGLEYLDHVMALDADSAIAIAPIIASFPIGEGHVEAAAPWIDRASALENEMASAQAERAEVRATDELAPAEISPELQRQLGVVLSAHPHVKHAWIARKKLLHLADRAPVYVVGVVRKWTWFPRVTNAALAQELADALATAIESANTFVFLNGSGTALMFRRLRKIGTQLV